MALYSIGALLSLLLAFAPAFSVAQAINCLVLSWILGIGAAVVGLLSEGRIDWNESE